MSQTRSDLERLEGPQLHAAVLFFGTILKIGLRGSYHGQCLWLVLTPSGPLLKRLCLGLDLSTEPGEHGQYIDLIYSSVIKK